MAEGNTDSSRSFTDEFENITLTDRSDPPLVWQAGSSMEISEHHHSSSATLSDEHEIIGNTLLLEQATFAAATAADGGGGGVDGERDWAIASDNQSDQDVQPLQQERRRLSTSTSQTLLRRTSGGSHHSVGIPPAAGWEADALEKLTADLAATEHLCTPPLGASNHNNNRFSEGATAQHSGTFGMRPPLPLAGDGQRMLGQFSETAPEELKEECERSLNMILRQYAAAN